jgi:phenylalanyl-tRNA synthetase alpha chain
MSKLNEKIQKISNEFESALKNAKDLKTLDNIRVQFLGKKGFITSLMSEIKNLSVEEKREFAPKLNQLKKDSEEKIKQTKEELVEKLAAAANLKKQNFDVTAYKTDAKKGHLHPYSTFIQEIEDIALSMGFDLLDSPEVETDFYNFTALNIPQDHPARDMYDTLWLNEKNMLLRTHTSPAQIHAMQTKPLPIAGFVIGRTFRYEAVDATHDVQFMQCEGILIDKNITLAHLFGVAKKFLQKLFDKKDLDIRIRPGFFPFVEPGIEIDMRCPFCKHGCGVCKKTTWLEVFPGGLIHPNVLKYGGIDPEKYSGFAFGFGLTRLLMLKYKINDIRYLHNGKLKFLEQF